MSKTVFLVAGGTGGHVFPAMALAEELISRGVSVECITDKRGERFFLKTSLVPHVVKSGGWPADWQGRFKEGWKIVRGMIHSFELCREYSPNVVVGFGGYPSFPTVKAAQLLKIPTVLHEQNAVFGRANRQLAEHARALAVSFADTRQISPRYKARTKLVGNPVRTTLLENMPEYALPEAGQPLRILIFGGSQGSSVFSTVVPQAIELLSPEHRERLVIVQQARLEDIDAVNLAYNTLSVSARVQPFFNDMAKLYQKAHLVIARAGASTVAELGVTGRPSVLVPFASSLDGDQAQNAQNMVERNAAWMMLEKDFTPESLAARLTDIINNPAQLAAAAQAAKALGRPNAAKELADLVLKAAS